MKQLLVILLGVTIAAPGCKKIVVHQGDGPAAKTEEIVLRFFHTFNNKTEWQPLLSEELEFQSPVNHTTTKSDFIPLDIMFRQIVGSATLSALLVDGNHASALVNYQLYLPNGNSLNIEFSEIMLVEDERISSIRVFYNTIEFNKFLTGVEGE